MLIEETEDERRRSERESADHLQFSYSADPVGQLNFTIIFYMNRQLLSSTHFTTRHLRAQLCLLNFVSAKDKFFLIC